MSSVEDILKMEGIIIRLIPVISTSLYAYKGKDHKLKENQEMVATSHKRKMIKENRVNTLGGKYLVTFKNDQHSTIVFSTKRDGVGDTIEEALLDYERKTNV